MPDNRQARRESDPGLQPERTSLAWLRTLLGYGALMALAIRNSWHHSELPFWISLAIVLMATFILWRYTLNRNLMDVARGNFDEPKAIRDKLLIALAILFLALLFSVTHLKQIVLLFQEYV